MLTTSPQAPAGSGRLANVPGRGSIVVSRRGGRSVVTRAYATSPLRLLTPANHGHAAWVFTSNYGGGLVDGDDLAASVDVGAGASGYLSTQSSTKVYRSPGGTRARTDARVAAGGLLVVAPDPVVPFAGSRYRQHQCYELEADGAIVVVDMLVSGRRASGERWRFDALESIIEVRSDGRLRVYDAVTLRASDGELAERFGRFNAFASVVMVGGSLRHEIADALDAGARRQVGRRADLLVAESPLADDGCLVRVLATTAEAASGVVRELLRFVPARLGDDPWQRKW